MILDRGEIERLLPHRFPMLLVDQIVDLVPGKRVVGLKRVGPDEWFVKAAEAPAQQMPPTLIIEAMAQCGGFLALKGLEAAGQAPEDKVFYFLSIEGCEFFRPVKPGDELRVEVQVLRDKGTICKLQGRAYVDQELAGEAVILIAQS